MLYAIHMHKNYVYILFYIELLHSLSYFTGFKTSDYTTDRKNISAKTIKKGDCKSGEL